MPGGKAVVLFGDRNFAGRAIKVWGSVKDLGDFNFDNECSSIAVTGGKWLLYKDVEFEGEGIEYDDDGGKNGTGFYPRLGGWSNRIFFFF